MSIMKFKLKIERTDYWFWVLVYSDLESLRADANKHDQAWGVIQQQKGGGEGAGFYNQTLGITHRFERIKDGQLYPNIGIIRLAKPHIGTEIISHELLHAVAWAYRLKFNHGNLGRKYGSLWREEFFCYMYGGTFRKLNLLLYKKGIWH
jgi:hypothetical protein